MPTAELPNQLDGLRSIDHIAVPGAWRVLSAERVSATDGDRRLSDHDAYLVEVSPDPPRGDQAGRGAVPPDVRQARQEDMLEMQCSEANPEEPEGWGRIECARVTMPPSRRLFSCFAAIQLRG